MTVDICDCPVSLSKPEALAAWNRMVRAFLAHSVTTPEYLGSVLAEEPDFAMGLAAKGLFSLMLGRREMLAVAREAQAQALELPAPNLREALWVKALGEWLNGHPSRAVACMEDALRDNPRDTLSAKVSHSIRFILGDARGMRRSVEAVLGPHGTDHPLRGFLLGCHAFALEETGAYAEAEAAGLEGLACAPDDAWGLHAVAHVHDMRAESARGIRLIEENRAAWDHCNNFRYHVWWHKALLHLDRGEIDVVLDLYDREIREEKTDDYRDIANATSLLMRLTLEGVDVGDRWEELADHAENRAGDGCLVFADLHYMLALGAAGRFDAAADMTLRVTTDARRPGEMSRRFANPGLTAIAGLHSFAEGRFDTAFLNLAAARRELQTIGGSHAQRDVFERMAIDAGLRAGYVDLAEQILAERQAHRAGREDRFAALRMAQVDRARRIPAQ
jgi:tetratricopeptide (TPR) repeat protein